MYNRFKALFWNCTTRSIQKGICLLTKVVVDLIKLLFSKLHRVSNPIWSYMCFPAAILIAGGHFLLFQRPVYAKGSLSDLETGKTRFYPKSSSQRVMLLSIFRYVLDNGLYNNEASGFGLWSSRKGKVHLWLQISCCMTQSGTRVQDRPIAAADFLQIPKPARHNDLHLHIFKKFPPKKKLLD